MFFKKKVIDPVCGMEIKVNQSTYFCHYHNKDYYFCSMDCLNKFEANPQNYGASDKKECCGKCGSSEKNNHDHDTELNHHHCSNHNHKQKCKNHHKH